MRLTPIPFPTLTGPVGGLIRRARASSSKPPTFWGLATVKGKFERYDGTLELYKAPAIELTIDAEPKTAMMLEPPAARRGVAVGLESRLLPAVAA
jgi:hypothetical protein